MKVYEIVKKYKPIEIPWNIWRLFGTPVKQISVLGDQVSLGEDFASLDEARQAVAWYVDQLGGKVKWEK